MYSTELKDGFQKGKTTPTPNEKTQISIEDLEFIEKMSKMVGSVLTKEEFEKIKKDRLRL